MAPPSSAVSICFGHPSHLLRQNYWTDCQIPTNRRICYTKHCRVFFPTNPMLSLNCLLSRLTLICGRLIFCKTSIENTMALVKINLAQQGEKQLFCLFWTKFADMIYIILSTDIPVTY